jgi:hypothetical protein
MQFLFCVICSTTPPVYKLCLHYIIFSTYHNKQADFKLIVETLNELKWKVANYQVAQIF